jgi:ABC-type transport system involved in multi-copper enzyme maturation permease subunit
MNNALKSELFRLRRRPQTWIMPILSVAFIAFFYAILYRVYQFGSEDDQPGLRDSIEVGNIFENGMQIFGFFGSILVVIVTASLIGSEYGWNTIRPLVARAQSRVGLLSAKWIVVALYTVFMVIVGIVGSLSLAAIFSVFTEGGLSSLPGGFWMDVVVGTGRWIVASLPYAAIGFAAALLARSNAAGIAIGIGISFVESLIFPLLTFVSDIFDTVQQFGISWNAEQLVSISTQPEESFFDPVSASQAWQSTAVLTVYMVVIVAATFIVFKRRDIISG